MDKLDIKIWKSEKLLPEITADIETTVAPFESYDHKPVLFQATDSNQTVYLVRVEDISRFFRRNSEAKFIFHNAVFDLDVLLPILGQDKIFELIDNKQIFCTKLLYKLYTLASRGAADRRASLKGAIKDFYGIDVEKGEERVTFGQYLGKPIEEISENHIKYAALDVIYTHRLYCDLIARITPLDKMGTLLSYDIQIKGDYALNRIYKNGLGFDLKRANAWMEDANEKLFKMQEKLSTYGWVRGAPGVNNRFDKILELEGISDKLPKTETGKISKSSDDLEKFSDNTFIREYLNFTSLEKASQFLRNIDTPVLHGRFNSILNTGRVSQSSPNLMQLPRTGGIRECFVPKKPENSFFIVDYSGMENCMLAQVLINKYGTSRMAQVINDGIDIHRYYASVMFNKKEKDVTKEERQQAKAAVFGFPGGLGIDTFKTFASGYGLKLSDDECQFMKNKYFEAFPEMELYLKECNDGDVFTLTGRRRANATYCAVANTPFQGLGADMAKLAMYELTRNNFHLVAFVHDEFIAEEKETASRLDLMCDIMIKAGGIVAPDVRIGVDGHITKKWEKL